MEKLLEEMPWLTEAEARNMLAKGPSGSKKLENLPVKALRAEAARQNVAVKNLKTKANIVKAIETKNAESHLKLREKKRILKSAMASKGLLTKAGVAQVLGGRNFKNLSRANLSKIQTEVRATEKRRTPSPNIENSPKIKLAKALEPRRPHYRLRNENLNVNLNQLANRAATERPVVQRSVVQRPAMPMVTPRAYQLRVVKAIHKMPGLIAVHSIGSGKTLTAILCAKELLAKGTVKRVVVITQKTLIESFKMELAAHGGGNFSIFGYKEFVNFAKEKPADFLKDAFVIIDEIHEMRTAKERFESTFRVVRHAPKVLGLTATPIVNDLRDLENQVRLVNKGAQVDTNDPSIGRYFSFYERSLDDPDFPKLEVYEVQIPMTQTYFNRWRNMGESDFHHIKRQNILDTLDAHDDNSKFAWALNKVESIIKSGGKVIVYSAFVKRGLHRFMAHLKTLKIPYALIEGEVESAQRRQAMVDYNLGRKKVILLSSAGGQGIDLKETSAVIVIEPPWHPSGVYQVIGRGVRFGSHNSLPIGKRKVDAYLLQAQPVGPYDPNLLTDKKMYDRFVWTKQDAFQQAYEAMSPFSIEGATFKPTYPKVTYRLARSASNISPKSTINQAIAKKPSFKTIVNLAMRKGPEAMAKAEEMARRILQS